MLGALIGAGLWASGILFLVRKQIAPVAVFELLAFMAVGALIGAVL